MSGGLPAPRARLVRQRLRVPVADALDAAIADRRSGHFSWQDWDAAPARCRDAFAQLAGVDPATVSLHGSAAESVATVARSLPPGSVVIPGSDYRSVLYPVLALDQGRNPGDSSWPACPSR